MRTDNAACRVRDDEVRARGDGEDGQRVCRQPAEGQRVCARQRVCEQVDAGRHGVCGQVGDQVQV